MGRGGGEQKGAASLSLDNRVQIYVNDNVLTICISISVPVPVTCQIAYGLAHCFTNNLSLMF